MLGVHSESAANEETVEASVEYICVDEDDEEEFFVHVCLLSFQQASILSAQCDFTELPMQSPVSRMIILRVIYLFRFHRISMY